MAGVFFYTLMELKIARQMGAKTKFSASEAAEAMNYMAMAGWKTGDMLDGIEGIMNLAAASGEDLATTSDIVTDTLTAMGMTASESGHFADILAAFSQMTDSEKAANTEALVGKNAMSGFLAVMNAAPGDIQKLNGAISNCEGTAEKMAASMQDNLAGHLTILKSQLEELAISVGEILMPSIRQIVGWIQGLVDWLNGLDEGTKKIIVTIALVAAAVAPVLIIIGKVVGAIGTIMTVVPQIAAAISGVIAFVSGAVIAIIVVLWNKCDWFWEAVIAVWEAIKSATIAAWNAVKEFLVNLWNGILETGKTVWNGLASFFTSCWQGIQTMFTAVLTAISTFFSTIWTGIQTVVQTVMNVIRSMVSGVWNNVKSVTSSALNAVRSAVSNMFNHVVYSIRNAMGNVYITIVSGVNQAVGYYHGACFQRIPVYVGGTLLDEVVVNAQARQNCGQERGKAWRLYSIWCLTVCRSLCRTPMR